MDSDGRHLPGKSPMHSKVFMGYSWLQGAQVSFTTYHLPLTTYHLPLTTYHLPLTTYHLPLTTYHLPDISAAAGESLDLPPLVQQGLV